MVRPAARIALEFDAVVNVSRFFFEGGCLFLLPYLFFYALAGCAGMPTRQILVGFWGLHLLMSVLLVPFLLQRIRAARRSDLWFGVLLFLVFLLPGAYLEFPADPWEHVRRLFSWQNQTSIGGSDTKWKFVYFWGWSFLCWVKIPARRLALAVYGAFWEWVLARQVVRVAEKFGYEGAWAKVQAIAFVLLFGNNVFSYRYYALSSSPAAYTAYLEAILVISLLLQRWEWRKTIRLILLCLIMAANHFEEVLLLAFSGAVMGACAWLNRQSKRQKEDAAVLFLSLVAATYAWGWCYYHYFPLASWSFSNLFADHVTPFGTIKVWKPHIFYSDAWGLHGLLGIGCALWLFRRQTVPAALSLTPLFLLSFPLFVIAAGRYGGWHFPLYRIIYLFPTSFMLVAGLREVLRRGPGRAYAPVWAGILIVLISLPCRFPYRGRLFFQLHRSPPLRSLVPVDATAAWFAERGISERDCPLLTDEATQFALTAHLGWTLHSERISMGKLRTLNSPAAVENYLVEKKVCRVLVALPDRVPEFPPSAIVRLSGHWLDPMGDLRALAPASFAQSVAVLAKQKRWRETEVPPWYRLYETAAVNAASVRE